MAVSSHGSVSGWLIELRQGHDSAAQQLWNRYFALLLPLARHRLQGLARESDEEDIALSALKSAMLGVRNNRFPDLQDRGDFWPLLVTITARKAIDEIKRQKGQKRDCARNVHVPDVDAFVGAEPSAEFVIQFVDQLEKLVVSLGDEVLRTIVALKLEGCSTEEIAAKLNVSRRTIDRKLRRIKQEWEIDGVADGV